METSRYQRYRDAKDELPTRSLEWPLYGAGVDKLGLDGKPVERSVPENGPDELVIRPVGEVPQHPCLAHPCRPHQKELLIHLYGFSQ